MEGGDNSVSLENWYVYMVRCADNSLYTGITTDITRRIDEHNAKAGAGAGAKYTRARQPVNLVYQQGPYSRSQAASREYEIKTYTKLQKEQLLVG